MANSDLNAAKKAKKDEFYTQLSDIENELRHYKEHFRGKTVLCNCDDPRVSMFFHYFAYQFEALGLKRLITTCYKNQTPDLFSQHDCERAIWLEYLGDKNGNRIPDPEEIGIRQLQGDGDFRSQECIELLKQADIVVTNPPFSLFREYLAQLVKYEQITDNIEYEIATYLNEVTKGEISDATAAKIKRMYKIIGEMESLGDSGEAISRILSRARHYKQDFDESMRSKIDRMMDLVETAYQAMMDNLRGSLKAPLTDISNATDAEDAINAYRNALREEHIANLEKSTYNYSAGVFYMDIVSELERIGDFIINISQAVYKDGDKK